MDLYVRWSFHRMTDSVMLTGSVVAFRGRGTITLAAFIPSYMKYEPLESPSMFWALFSCIPLTMTVGVPLDRP